MGGPANRRNSQCQRRWGEANRPLASRWTTSAKAAGLPFAGVTVAKVAQSSLSGCENLETGFYSSIKANQNSSGSGELEHRSDPQPSKEMLWLTQLLILSPRMGEHRVTSGR